MGVSLNSAKDFRQFFYKKEFAKIFYRQSFLLYDTLKILQYTYTHYLMH